MKTKNRAFRPPLPPQVTRAGQGEPVAHSDQRRLKVERIEEIERLMASAAWSGAKAYELADFWKVSLKTVEGYAAEASRRIRAEFDPEERKKLKALWLRKIEQAQAECLRIGDLNAHGKMLDLEARALGHFDIENTGPTIGKVSIVVHGPDGMRVTPFPPPDAEPEETANAVAE